MSEEGARRRLSAAERFSRDAAVLENALITETDPFLSARYKFYLAQSYLDAGEKDKALSAYQERATLGFWDQEVFISLYRSANLKADLGFDEEDVIASYLRAHDVRKDRAEALYGAARYCRIKQKYQQGFDLATRALKIKPPNEGLFLEDWVYRYALLDEFAVNAYWIERYQDCLDACQRLLSEGKMPAEMHDRVKQNADLARHAADIVIKQDAIQPAFNEKQLDGTISNRRICLSMIVKNEAPVITRCLASVLPIIDYWIICDTGSTDGTQDIIRNFFAEHGKPGELHERPWKDFAHNRSEALTLSRPHADYSLIIDADDVLELPPGFKLPFLNADSYTVEIRQEELRYVRTQLIRAALPWRYEGVLHEFLTCGRDSNGDRVFPENLSHKALLGVHIRMTKGGARRRVTESERYSRDAAVLAAALATETDPFLIARYNFYLAQSHQNAGEKQKALEHYLKRAGLGFWQQEIFISLYQAANLKAQLGHAPDEVIEAYAAAARADPRRAEALHGAARYCREQKRYQQGYELAKRALHLHPPEGALFLARWVYDYGVLDEYSVTAYWIGEYDECLRACSQLLDSGRPLPEGYTSRIEANVRFASERIREKRAAAKENSSALGQSVSAQIPQQQAICLDTIVKSERSDESRSPKPVLSSQQKRHIGNTLHVLGVSHTIPHDDYLVCAFTAKVLLFPEVIQPFGWDVIEYSNEGSASKAREHVVILTKDRLQALSRRTSREEPLDADVNNTDLQKEFQRVLLEKIRSRAKPGDIVCHVWGPNMEVYDLLRDCHHIELCVGYTASPGLPFRVYESSAWMHWHYGKAGQEDGNHYKWVIPSPIDVDKWVFCEEPDDYAVFLGRVTIRKGINELAEIARRMPELPIHVYGPGDPSHWAKGAPANLVFKGPIFGDERVDVVRRARCMLMPTVFIEPFGNSGIEAQLCGVPLIASSYGAFQETVVEGVTGYRCHTLADWVAAIQMSKSLDRRQIATLARGKYAKEVVGKQYDWVLRQLADLSGRGWYTDKSRKFASGAVLPQKDTPRKPRIWLYMPYFGAFPNYFQLYLDSLAQNVDCLSVFLMTDSDLSGYRVPDNLIRIPLTLDALREKAARLINNEFGMNVQADALLKKPYKLADFRIMYPELFRDISEQYGVSEDDFVGWGDCDLIYGRVSDFLDMNEDYQVIGGLHGHLTAVRNIDSFTKLFKTVEGLPGLLLDEISHAVDEIAFRKPLQDFLERNGHGIFQMHRYFCDIVPQCYFGMFRKDHAQRKKNFFDNYHPDKEIDYVHYDRDGRLTVVYEDGDSRQSIYCHMQKRAMLMDSDRYENGYYIREDAFRLAP